MARRTAEALIAGTLAGILLVEGALRVAFGFHGITAPHDIIYDRELGWTLAPGTREWQSGVDYGVWVATDADGLRVDDSAPPSSAHADWPTLLVLGDSYAFGYGVAGYAMFSTALERELARTPAPHRVRTAGVPGYSTDQEYLTWRRIGARVKPRQVVLLFHASDLVDNVRSSVIMGPERYYKPRFELRGGQLELTGLPVPDKRRLTAAGIAEPLKAWFRPLATYALVQSAMLRARSSAVVAADHVAAPAVAPPAADDITGALVGALARDVHDAGGTVTVALVPSDPVVTSHVAAICRAKRIPFIDLGPAFAGARAVQLPFDGHWNARGHAVAAHAVAAAVGSDLDSMHAARTKDQ